MVPETDLLQEMWQCIRLWLFDFYFTSSYPFEPARKYGFSPAVFHALSHWKECIARNSDSGGKRLLEARYHKQYWDDEADIWRVLSICPDGGECGLIDYSLRQLTDHGWETLVAVESEYDKSDDAMLVDFNKLLNVASPYKVMIHRIAEANRNSYFNERKRKVELAIGQSMKARSIYYPHEQWLLIGIPWYTYWPNNQIEAGVKLHTFSLPSDQPIELREPRWDIWKPASEIETWFRSLYVNR